MPTRRTANTKTARAAVKANAVAKRGGGAFVPSNPRTGKIGMNLVSKKKGC